LAWMANAIAYLGCGARCATARHGGDDGCDRVDFSYAVVQSIGNVEIARPSMARPEGVLSGVESAGTPSP